MRVVHPAPLSVRRLAGILQKESDGVHIVTETFIEHSQARDSI